MKSSSEIRALIQKYFPKYRPTTDEESQMIAEAIKRLLEEGIFGT